MKPWPRILAFIHFSFDSGWVVITFDLAALAPQCNYMYTCTPVRVHASGAPRAFHKSIRTRVRTITRTCTRIARALLAGVNCECNNACASVTHSNTRASMSSWLWPALYPFYLLTLSQPLCCFHHLFIILILYFVPNWSYYMIVTIFVAFVSFPFSAHHLLHVYFCFL